MVLCWRIKIPVFIEVMNQDFWCDIPFSPCPEELQFLLLSSLEEKGNVRTIRTVALSQLYAIEHVICCICGRR